MAQTKMTGMAERKAAADWPGRITQAAFVLLLVVVCARATMSEMLRDPFDPQPGMGPIARDGAGPAGSLILSLLCCVPALLVLTRRVVDPTYLVRWSWSHAPMLALATWTGLSVLWAGDKFAATINAANWIGALAIIWAGVQLVRSWGRLRLVAAMLMGILFVHIAAGLEYRYVDLPELRRDFQSRRAEILRERGLEEGSFAAKQFERKVLGGDIGQFSLSPNTYAAGLVLMGFVAAGVMIQRLSNNQSMGWALVMLPALGLGGVVLSFTQSRTAAGLAALGVVMLLVIGLVSRWLTERARLAYWLGVGTMLLGWTAIVGHGLAHGNLVERSLTFRWYYWIGAARLVAEHPLLGVGWANFGPRYLAVRLPAAAEEVKDPHNFVMKALAELGVVGGALMLAWLGRLWWELTRPTIAPPAASKTLRPGRSTLVTIALLAIGGMALNALFSIDWTQGGSWIFLQAFRRAIGALLLMIGLGMGSLSSLAEESVDESPGPWVLYGMLVGAGVFLLHSLVDFAMFETSGMHLLAATLGSAAGIRYLSEGRGMRRWLAVMLLAVLGTGWLVATGALVGRTVTAEMAAHAGDEAIRGGRFSAAVNHYAAAAGILPWNADYAWRAAQASMYSEAAAPHNMTLGLLEMAIQANPYEVKYHATEGAFEAAASEPDVKLVKDSYERAIALDPRNVGLRVAYADALARLKDPSAVEQYRRALANDDALPEDEPKRLSRAERQRIETKIHQLSTAETRPA